MRGRIAAAALVGFVAGAIAIATLGSDQGDRSDATTDGPGTSAATPTSETTPTETAAATPSSVPAVTAGPPADPAVATLLVWTSGGLPPGFAHAVADLATVAHSSVVSGDEVGLLTAIDDLGVRVEHHTDGWNVPLDVLALDPALHARFVAGPDSARFDDLEPGTGLLGETSATLRGLGPGATLELETGRVAIVGVISDLAAAGAELVVHTADATRLAVDTERYLLVNPASERLVTQSSIDDVLTTLDAQRPIRFRTPAETTWLRHGDAVVPAALVKARFGEFAVRGASGRAVEMDPAWLAEHIVVADVPILGSVRCHRDVIEPLSTALADLADAGLAHLVDPDQYGGCQVARRIGVGLALSRHAWGIALDINVGDNPRGSFDTQDPALVEALRAVGFGWGGTWLVPDPAHYESIDLR